MNMPLPGTTGQHMMTLCISLACGSLNPSCTTYLDHCGLLYVSVLHVISTTCCYQSRPFVASYPCDPDILILLSLLNPSQPGLVHCAPRKPNQTRQ